MNRTSPELTPRSWRRLSLLLFALLALLGAACAGESNSPGITGSFGTEPDNEIPEGVADGTDSDSADTDSADTDSADTDSADAEVGAPSRIVSLSATATESLFAIGAGDQVVAVDSLSNYPSEAPTTDLSAFDPNLEAIAAQDPDLVIISWDPGELVSGLAELDIATLVQPTALSLGDAYAQIEDLGVATGHEDEAAQVVAAMQESVEEIAGSQPDRDEPLSVYHEVDDTFYSASSSSFLGELYGLLGLANIADEADADGTGFPQLSAEYIIEINPGLIVITDQVGYDVAEVESRAGWDTIDAVADGKVLQVDADLASRWGPRVVEFLQTISDATAE